MVVWGRGIGNSLDRDGSKKRYRCPFTHTNANRRTSQGVRKPRNGCPDSIGRASEITTQAQDVVVGHAWLGFRKIRAMRHLYRQWRLLRFLDKVIHLADDESP